MAYVQALENGAFAMTLPQLTKAIRTDLMVPDTALANLAAACTQRMAERAEFDLAIAEAADAVELIAVEGAEAAMTRVNQR